MRGRHSRPARESSESNERRFIQPDHAPHGSSGLWPGDAQREIVRLERNLTRDQQKIEHELIGGVPSVLWLRLEADWWVGDRQRWEDAQASFVRGRGRPFMEASKTVNVSRSGAMLRDVPTKLVIGDVIGLRSSNNKRYRFRVVWIGTAGSSDAGNVGLQSLDSGEWIWKDLKLPADDIDIYARPPESERRLLNRVRCFLSAEVVGNRMGQKALAFIRDISLGGCYVTMTFPFPVEAKVGLGIWLDEQTKIWTDGIVISSHPSTGIGLKFVGMSRPNSLALERCLNELSVPVERLSLPQKKA